MVVIGDLSEEGMIRLRPTGWNEEAMGRADEEHFRQRKQRTQRPRGGKWFAGFNQWQERSLWMQHHESEEWHFLGAREVGRSLFSFCFGFCFHLPMVNNGKGFQYGRTQLDLYLFGGHCSCHVEPRL